MKSMWFWTLALSTELYQSQLIICDIIVWRKGDSLKKFFNLEMSTLETAGKLRKQCLYYAWNYYWCWKNLFYLEKIVGTSRAHNQLITPIKSLKHNNNWELPTGKACRLPLGMHLFSFKNTWKKTGFLHLFLGFTPVFISENPPLFLGQFMMVSH